MSTRRTSYRFVVMALWWVGSVGCAPAVDTPPFGAAAAARPRPTPGRLGVADTPPYFHDGSAAPLGDVVDYCVRFLAIAPPPPPAARADSIASLGSL